MSQVIRRVTNGESTLSTDPIGVRGGRSISPRTPGQTRYVEAIRENALVFCTGPAGTGKTYLAVATAVEALRAQRIRKKSFWSAQPSKQARVWAICLAICKQKLILISAPCWMR